jgi:hypothetical protein
MLMVSPFYFINVVTILVIVFFIIPKTICTSNPQLFTYVFRTVENGQLDLQFTFHPFFSFSLSPVFRLKIYKHRHFGNSSVSLFIFVPVFGSISPIAHLRQQRRRRPHLFSPTLLPPLGRLCFVCFVSVIYYGWRHTRGITQNSKDFNLITGPSRLNWCHETRRTTHRMLFAPTIDPSISEVGFPYFSSQFIKKQTKFFNQNDRWRSTTI